MKKLFLAAFIASAAFGFSGDIKLGAQASFDHARSILTSASDMHKATDEIFGFLGKEFNINLMAMLSLGKEYKALSSEQKTAYLSAFESLLKKDFIDKISFYKDEKITVEGVDLHGSKGTITAKINYQGEAKTILLSIIRTKHTDDFLIYDIVVDDISLISTYRTQFASLYADNSFDEFLQKLVK